MKVKIFRIQEFQTKISKFLVGGEKEEIFTADIEDNIKVKKGELDLHLSVYDCYRVTTLEDTEELLILRIYRKSDMSGDWSLVKESIEVKDNILIQKSFIREAFPEMA